MTDWFRDDAARLRHPKTGRLARALEVKRIEAYGYHGALLAWTCEYARDGEIGRFAPVEIADACLWEGDADRFVAAFVRAGLVDEVDGTLVVHDWDETNAKRSEDAKKKDAERARRYRERKKERDRTSRDASRVTDGDASRSTNKQTNERTDGRDEQGGDAAEELTLELGESAPRRSTVDDLVEKWNELASTCGLSKVRAAAEGSKRRRHAEKLLQQLRTPAEVVAYVERLSRAPGALGRGRDRWKMDFDVFVRPGTRDKVLEGRYDEVWRPAGGASPSPRAPAPRIFEADDEQLLADGAGGGR